MREVLKAAVQAMVVVMICVAILLLGCSCKENSDETVIGNDKVVKEEFHVYLCFGQSNMEGAARIEDIDKLDIDPRFVAMHCTDCDGSGRAKGRWYKAVPPLTRCNTGLSPADYFGRTMVEHMPEHIKIGIINVAVGGCRIELFDKSQCSEYIQSSPEWLINIAKEYDNDPYKRLIEMAKKAQKEGAIIKGVLMHQGESNGGDSQWSEKVKSVYESILADINMNSADVPLLVGEVVSSDQGGICAGMNIEIATLPRVIDNCYVLSSAGCESAGDNLHFSAEGYRELGKRYAQTMINILNKTQQ